MKHLGKTVKHTKIKETIKMLNIIKKVQINTLL